MVKSILSADWARRSWRNSSFRATLATSPFSNASPVSVCPCVRVGVCMNARACVRVYTHAYVCVHVYVCACVRVSMRESVHDRRERKTESSKRTHAHIHATWCRLLRRSLRFGRVDGAAGGGCYALVLSGVGSVVFRRIVVGDLVRSRSGGVVLVVLSGLARSLSLRYDMRSSKTTCLLIREFPRGAV